MWGRVYGAAHTFGAAVIFKPSPTNYKTDKPLSTGMYGIFLGYRLAPGGTWNGEYLVEDLSYFVDVDFRMDAPRHKKSVSPRVTKQVRLPQNGTVLFPLKKHYDKIKFSFEGVLPGENVEEVEFDLPEYAEEQDAVSGAVPMESNDGAAWKINHHDNEHMITRSTLSGDDIWLTYTEIA
jgi:hypothetical protein